MPERIDTAAHLRAAAERLRQIAAIETKFSAELIKLALEFEADARKLERAAERDFGTKVG